VGRSALVIALLAIAAPASAEPSWIQKTFDHEVAERFVRMQVGMRDLAHAAVDRLAEWIAVAGDPIPDVSVLTVQPVANVESSGFGWRDDPIRHRPKWHSGADLKGKHGTPVAAAGDGVVTFTGRYYGYGNMITIDHGGGVITAYAHLRKMLVKPGMVISAGQQIGEVGSTGRATGPHLHFEVRLEGRAVDPDLAMRVGALQRTDPVAARWLGWALSPAAQSERTDRHDPPRHAGKPSQRPERRHAPVRDPNRS
jgi:murein DD-endopeptidase MepM/ murein hydrolase activator NlpD